REDDGLREFRARYDQILAPHMLPGSAGDQAGPNSAAESLYDVAHRQSIRSLFRPVNAAVVPNQARHLAIDGVANARHLGGIPLPGGGETRPVVIRSGELSRLTTVGIARLRELNVTDVVDLRRNDEHRDYPTPSLEHAGIAVARAPMYDFADAIAPD